MKQILFSGIFFILFTCTAFAQKHYTKNGSISFFSKTSLENIRADNNQVLAVLNIQTGDIQFSLLVKNFHFSKALMEEHFNENYMESEKFPFATFKGKVKETIDYTKNGTSNVTMEGTLDMHGVSLPRTITGTLTVKDGTIIMDSKFDVKVADHKIKVPSLYVEKIAEVIKVTFHTEMTPKK